MVLILPLPLPLTLILTLIGGATVVTSQRSYRPMANPVRGKKKSQRHSASLCFSESVRDALARTAQVRNLNPNLRRILTVIRSLTLTPTPTLTLTLTITLTLTLA